MTADETGMEELTIASTVDGSLEPSLFYMPEGGSDVPLLVGLHTWSTDRFNPVGAMLDRCRDLGWALLLPEFRGPNRVTNPRATEACASKMAKQDIMDAVDHVTATYAIDGDQIVILGGSGGGHMCLMMAAYAPKRWRAASSWCPITDVQVWHAESEIYADGIAACCGGSPGTSPTIGREYAFRSPIAYCDQLAQANLSVHHGRGDPLVPVSHTLRLAAAVEERRPDRFFHEIFDGGHVLHYDRAFAWLDSQVSSAPEQVTELSG